MIGLVALVMLGATIPAYGNLTTGPGLIVLDGPHRGAQYPLRREKTVIGTS